MNKKRVLQYSGVFIALLLLGLVVAFFSFPLWLKHKLKKEVEQQTKGNYALQMADLKASLFKNTLEIDSLSLAPVHAKKDEEKSASGAEKPKMQTMLKLTKLRLTGVNYLGILFRKPLQLDSVLLVAPQLHVTRLEKDTTAGKPLYQNLAGPLKNMQIKRLDIRDGAFYYKNNFRNKYNTAELKKLNLEISDLLLDSASFFDRKRTFYARTIEATVGETDMILPGQGHRLKMGVVSFGTRNREVKMQAVKLIPLYNTHLAGQKKRRTLWVELKLPELLFKNIDLAVYSRARQLVIDSVLVQSPALVAFGSGGNASEKGKKVKPTSLDSSQMQPLYKSLAGPLLKMRVKNIVVLNASLAYRNSFQDKFNTIELNKLELRVKDLALDSASFYDPQRTFYAAAYELNTGNTNFLLSGANYRLKTGPLTLNTRQGELLARQIKLVPLYSPMELGRRKKRSTTWMAMQMEGARFAGIDFPAYSRLGNIGIGSVVLERSWLKVYNDKKHFPEGSEDKIFPQDIMLNLKPKLKIEKARLRNMYVRYDEFDETATRPGYMILKNLNWEVRNISNDRKSMSVRHPAVSRISFTLKGQGEIRMVTRLNLLDPNCRQTIAGTFGKCNLQIFNSIMEPSKAVRIKSGWVKNGKFHMQLSRNTAEGTMLLLYKDFKIEMVNADGNKQNMSDKITTFLANAFVVNKENPEEGKPPRTVAVRITRHKSQSFISFWRDCLLTGFMTSVGLEKSK